MEKRRDKLDWYGNRNKPFIEKSIENEKDLFYSYNNHIRYFLEYKKNLFLFYRQFLLPDPEKTTIKR